LAPAPLLLTEFALLQPADWDDREYIFDPDAEKPEVEPVY
jgi:hypothetical protein